MFLSFVGKERGNYESNMRKGDLSEEFLGRSVLERLMYEIEALKVDSFLNKYLHTSWKAYMNPHPASVYPILKAKTKVYLT